MILLTLVTVVGAAPVLGIDPSIAAITGAALLFIGTIATILFGRKSARETSDLAAIRLLTEAQSAELIRVQGALGELSEKYDALLEEKRNDDERRRLQDQETGRIIGNLRFYVTDLLQWIARYIDHEPPAPRFPIE